LCVPEDDDGEVEALYLCSAKYTDKSSVQLSPALDFESVLTQLSSITLPIKVIKRSRGRRLCHGKPKSRLVLQKPVAQVNCVLADISKSNRSVMSKVLTQLKWAIGPGMLGCGVECSWGKDEESLSSNHVVQSSLNGCNGEATNSDDTTSAAGGRTKKGGKNVKKSTTRKTTKTVVIANQSRRNVQRQARIPRSLREPDSYRIALQDPFDPRAIGCRVPDMYSQPTATYHMKGTIVLQSNASSVCSVVLTPNPYISCIDMCGVAGAGSVASSSMYNYAGANATFAAASYLSIAQAFAEYRVVACGFTVRNQIPPTTCTGRVMMASQVMVGPNPGANQMVSNHVANSAQMDLMFGNTFTSGTDLTTGLPASLLNLPGAKDISLQDIISQSVRYVPKPITPQAFEFHSTLPGGVAINASQSLGNETVYTTATNAVVTFDLKDCTNMCGWQGLLLRAEGLPASTTIAYVDYIYHLEGTPPALNGSTGAGSLVPDAPIKSHVDIASFQSTLSNVLNKDNLVILNDLVDSGMNGYAKGGAAGAGVNVARAMLSRMGLSL
jgi:hypothetical protein